MDFKEFTAKTVDDAITEACKSFSVTSDRLEYEVVDEGSTGFLGIHARNAVIKAKIKDSIEDRVATFLEDVLSAMELEAKVIVSYDEEAKEMDVEISGEDMGILIGKRGQTLDSLQYLTSLVCNKERDEYIRVKVDTENYRQRRKDTLENLAKNMAFKVKRTKRAVSLEPMNPYERRVIHSALQDDKYVTTHSEGDEPFRHVVVTLKK